MVFVDCRLFFLSCCLKIPPWQDQSLEFIMAAEASLEAQFLLQAPERLEAEASGAKEAAEPSLEPLKDTGTRELHRGGVEYLFFG